MVSGFHPVTGEMSIVEPGAQTPFAPFGGVGCAGMVNLYLNSGPPNGVPAATWARDYEHLTPGGVKTLA